MTNEEGKTGTASASVTVNDVAPQFTAADLILSAAGDRQPRATPSRCPASSPTRTRSAHHGDDRLGRRLGAHRALRLFNEIVATATPGVYTLLGHSPVPDHAGDYGGSTRQVSFRRHDHHDGQHVDHGQPCRTDDPDRERRQPEHRETRSA